MINLWSAQRQMGGKAESTVCYQQTGLATSCLLSPPQIADCLDSAWTWKLVCTTKWGLKLKSGVMFSHCWRVSAVLKIALVLVYLVWCHRGAVFLTFKTSDLWKQELSFHLCVFLSEAKRWMNGATPEWWQSFMMQLFRTRAILGCILRVWIFSAGLFTPHSRCLSLT